MYGRQLARVHAPQYHETLFSRLYPGNQQSHTTYIPVLQALDSFLGFSDAQKARTILRSDAGFGSDSNVNSALTAHWQVMTKSSGGRRPTAVMRQIPDAAWQELRSDDRWVAEAPAPVQLARPVQGVALRWRTQRGDLKQALVVCSVAGWSAAELIAAYDDRGACETEIQADKGGLQMGRRRKKSAAAQEALILMTDVAHNLLAWMTPQMFPSGPLAQMGPTQLVQDVLAMPGRLMFERRQLVAVQLNQRHPYASEVASGLERLLDHFGYP
jgi:DDE family transposase